MSMRALLLSIAFALSATSLVRADDASDLAAAQGAYDRATELQRADPAASRAQFEAAAKGFQALVDRGLVNGPLLYNLGNAQMQLGQTGAAIGSYLRAQRLIPGDGRLQANLAHARTQVKDRFDRGSGLLLEDVAGWWHLLSQPTRLSLATIAWIAAWGLACARLLRPAAPIVRARGTPAAAWALGLTGAILLATVIVDVSAPAWRPVGVTVSDGVVVRKGNGDGFEPAFTEPLSQGVEFRVLEERPGWIQIRLPDGKSGWIRSLQASTA